MTTRAPKTTRNDVTEELIRLVRANTDSASGFDEAARDSVDPQLVSLFRDFAAARRDQAAELTACIEMSGEYVSEDRSWLGAIRRSWQKHGGSTRGKGDFAVLAEAVYREDQIRAAYRHALDATLHNPANDLIGRQYVAVKADRERICHLLDGRG